MERSAFGPVRDVPEVRVDFRELEMRVLASMTGPRMADLHKMRAADMFGVAIEDVTPEQRNAAKRRGYLEMYSASPETLKKFVDESMKFRPSWRAILRTIRRKLRADARKFWDRLVSMLPSRS